MIGGSDSKRGSASPQIFMSSINHAMNATYGGCVGNEGFQIAILVLWAEEAEIGDLGSVRAPADPSLGSRVQRGDWCQLIGVNCVYFGARVQSDRCGTYTLGSSVESACPRILKGVWFWSFGV